MIHQVFIDQDGQGGLHAAGAWQIVLPNKLVALGAHYPVCLGNGFEQRELVVGQENDAVPNSCTKSCRFLVEKMSI